MKGSWRRRLAVIVPAVCAFILLPIATNIATGDGLPELITRNKWLSWVGVVVFGLIAVSAILHNPSPPTPPPPALDPTATHDEAPQPDLDEPEPSGPAEPQDTAPVRVGNLPKEVRGRDSLLNRLRRNLREGGLVVLVGAGGTGKTTIARELIRRNRPPHGAGEQAPAWEVSGATPRSLIDGLRIVAENLGANAAELDAIRAPEPAGPECLWRLLEQAPSGWVLIIDNADDTEFLAKPAGPGAESPPRLAEGTGWARSSRRGLVIITSRQREKRFWPATATLYSVGLLSVAQAAQILRDLAPRAGSRVQAQALARRLGRLPLALHLAGRYLGSKFAVHTNFDAYRVALESDPTVIRFIELHPNDPEAVERMMVMLTWELSLDALAEHGMPQARPLLRLLSCYAPAMPVPLSLLKSELVDSFLTTSVDQTGHRGATHLRVDQVLQSLDQLGLIDPVVPSGKTATPEAPEPG